MKKEYRIKKSSEIDAVFELRESKGDKYFVVYKKIEENEKHFRFAISIGKKFGDAHLRNKCKRRIREIIKKYSLEISTKSLFVIVVKPSANSLDFKQINESILVLLKKSKLMENIDEKNS